MEPAEMSIPTPSLKAEGVIYYDTRVDGDEVLFTVDEWRVFTNEIRDGYGKYRYYFIAHRCDGMDGCDVHVYKNGPLDWKCDFCEKQVPPEIATVTALLRAASPSTRNCDTAF